MARSKVNKSKITDENTFNGDHSENETNPGSSKEGKAFFLVFF